MDRSGPRQMDRWSGRGEMVNWGWEATHSIWTVGGPLDWAKGDLGNVELHRCSFKASKHV